MTNLPLNQIIQIMYRHCMEKINGLVTVKFNHRVINVGRHADHAWVEVEAGEGDAKEKKRFTADYVVGCDGATSAVRKALFGREWPGQNFDCRLLVQNVRRPVDISAQLIPRIGLV
jgi:2-polyprenyl-6-methoxyphenol hydroxylase-like FAD-dependent oxidoreductase